MVYSLMCSANCSEETREALVEMGAPTPLAQPNLALASLCRAAPASFSEPSWCSPPAAFGERTSMASSAPFPRAKALRKLANRSLNAMELDRIGKVFAVQQHHTTG